MCAWSNHVPRGADMCCCTLDLWHWRHVRAQFLTSLLTCGQTKQATMSCWVARMPGWDRECSTRKTSYLKMLGTNGRGTPVVTSQSRVLVDDCSGMGSMWKEHGWEPIHASRCLISGSSWWVAAICSKYITSTLVTDNALISILDRASGKSGVMLTSAPVSTSKQVLVTRSTTKNKRLEKNGPGMLVAISIWPWSFPLVNTEACSFEQPHLNGGNDTSKGWKQN